MNKHELINKVVAETGNTQKDVKVVLDHAFKAISREIRTTITGFGTFRNDVRKAYQTRNPKTGERMTVPETPVFKFKASK